MKKLNIKKKMADTFDLPEEYAVGSLKISIIDFNTVGILNYKSIVEYGENIIKINTKDKMIRIEGETLIIDNITDDEIKIKGNIKSLLFE